MGQRGNVRRGGRAACVRKSRRMLIFCGLPPPVAHTSKSPGPSPKPALQPWQKNKNNNKWAGENHCQIWAGPSELLPLSFSVLAVVWVKKSPIMWVKMHGYMSFSPSGELEPSWCCGGFRPEIYTSRPLMKLLLMTCTHTHTWRECGQVVIRAGAHGLHLNSRELTSHVLDRCNYHPFNLGSVSQPSQTAFSTLMSSFVP